MLAKICVLYSVRSISRVKRSNQKLMYKWLLLDMVTGDSDKEDCKIFIVTQSHNRNNNDQ